MLIVRFDPPDRQLPTGPDVHRDEVNDLHWSGAAGSEIDALWDEAAVRKRHATWQLSSGADLSVCSTGFRMATDSKPYPTIQRLTPSRLWPGCSTYRRLHPGVDFIIKRNLTRHRQGDRKPKDNGVVDGCALVWLALHD